MPAGRNRGSLSIADLLIVLFILAITAALWPVVLEQLNSQSAGLSLGERYLWLFLLPGGLLVLLYAVYSKAVSGGG
jgi:TRAP-type C4-dicarboxylate transport system permease small subunit